jgi:hypothetical protein
MLPAVFGGSLLTRLGVTAAAIAAAWAGGCLYRGHQVPGEISAERDRVLGLERSCADGSVCAGSLEQRAAAQASVVQAAAAAAAARAAEAAEADARLERAALADRAAADRLALEQARSRAARLERALQTSQECRAWSEQPVPCPVE